MTWFWIAWTFVRGIPCWFVPHVWFETEPWAGELNGRRAFMAPFTYCKRCGKLRP